MRRRLVAVLLAHSLLWVGGGAVLAVVVHEHAHHTELHGHEWALRTADHGHLHGTEPDHDHHLAGALGARLQSIANGLFAVTPGPAAPNPFCAAASALAMGRSFGAAGPPAYLAHCALLT